VMVSDAGILEAMGMPPLAAGAHRRSWVWVPSKSASQPRFPASLGLHRRTRRLLTRLGFRFTVEALSVLGRLTAFLRRRANVSMRRRRTMARKDLCWKIPPGYGHSGFTILALRIDPLLPSLIPASC